MKVYRPQFAQPAGQVRAGRKYETLQEAHEAGREDPDRYLGVTLADTEQDVNGEACQLGFSQQFYSAGEALILVSRELRRDRLAGAGLEE